ncbi:hypothetical protein [Photobacterium kishitanii]|nr:hypothetical protein [Photobacterium kishitanii]
MEQLLQLYAVSVNDVLMLVVFAKYNSGCDVEEIMEQLAKKHIGNRDEER